MCHAQADKDTWRRNEDIQYLARLQVPARRRQDKLSHIQDPPSAMAIAQGPDCNQIIASQSQRRVPRTSAETVKPIQRTQNQGDKGDQKFSLFADQPWPSMVPASFIQSPRGDWSYDWRVISQACVSQEHKDGAISNFIFNKFLH